MATLPNINNAGPKMPDEDFGKSPDKLLWGEHLLYVQPKTIRSVVWKIWNNKTESVYD